MKALIVVAAAALAFPVYAQQKNDTTVPNAEQRAQNREKVQEGVNNTKEKLPSAEDRAQNREKVSSGAHNASLTGKVKAALANDAGMKTLGKIDVDSDNGVVTLKGKVASADVKKKAGDIAKKVEGVKSVKNQLSVEKS